MADLDQATASLDWADIESQLDEEGYAVVPRLFDGDQVRDLSTCLGEGDRCLLQPPFPPALQALRESFHRRLAPIADRWSELSGDPPRRHASGSHAVLTRLHEGEYQELHQHADVAHAFAFQLALLLGEPGRDFTGGEFVMVEQRPRMQSRPMVVPLRQGDVAIVAAAQRPHRGSHGYYRVKVRHAVGRVRGGERLALDLFFHDARVMT